MSFNIGKYFSFMYLSDLIDETIGSRVNIFLNKPPILEIIIYLILFIILIILSPIFFLWLLIKLFIWVLGYWYCANCNEIQKPFSIRNIIWRKIGEPGAGHSSQKVCKECYKTIPTTC